MMDLHDSPHSPYDLHRLDMYDEIYDYESMFKHYSRAAALTKFINLDSPSKDINKIFYLLNKSERELILNLIITNKLDIDLKAVWPYLTDQERKFLLGVVLTNKYDYNLSLINNSLTNEEKGICFKHKSIYKYPFINLHFTIKEWYYV